MERRRKALGLRKIYNEEEKKTVSAKVQNEPEGGKRHQKSDVTPRNSSSLKNNLTPKETTPKSCRNMSLLKAESPASPLFSPSQHAMVIRRMFGSPEVEVSWDWGCSQVINEIGDLHCTWQKYVEGNGPDCKVARDLSFLCGCRHLYCPQLSQFKMTFIQVPVRRLTRASQSQPVPALESVTFSYPRLPPNKQMSEEENQERLEFYKNIFSKSLTRNQKDSTKNNNNVDKEVDADQNANSTTPKRPLKCKAESSRKDQVNAIFDDSANEFMLECSQAIEEQLKNGDICTGQVINIDIKSKKHPHSPLEQSENAVKKLCHGKTKQNLFPESSKFPDHNHMVLNKKRPLSLKSPKNKLNTSNTNCAETSLQTTEVKHTFEDNNDISLMRPTQTSRPPVVKSFLVEKSSNVNTNEKVHIESVACKVKGTIADLRKEPDKAGSTVNTKNNSNQEAKRLQPKMFINNKFVTSENHTNTKTNGNGNTLHYDSVNKFRRSQNGAFPKNYQNLNEPQGCITIKNKAVTADYGCKASLKECSITSRNAKTVLNDNLGGSVTNSNANGVANVTSGALIKDTKPKSVDVTPLLDDGFDMDLCTLDFDSLCCNSQPKLPLKQVVTETVPKLCSEQEIEAKRLAALNRLLMKKKK